MLLELLNTASPGLQFSISVFCGLILGSFLNTVIFRLPQKLFLMWQTECQTLHAHPPLSPSCHTTWQTRSHCPHCQRLIPWFDNIPLLSFCLLRGRCRFCHTQIPWHYPLIEGIGAVLLTLLIFYYGWSIQTLMLCVCSFCLLALAWIDLEHKILPDELVFTLLWGGFLYNHYYTSIPLIECIWGVILGYSSLWLICKFFFLTTGKIGMGCGDFKLLAALGAWTGYAHLGFIIFLSSVLGSLFGILYISIKNIPKDSPLAFGHYLALSGWISIIYGETLSSWYLKIF